MPRKLSESKALELVGTLSRTEKFPEDDAGVRLMAKTLMEAAPEPELAKKVVEELRRVCRFCPTDAEIFHVATGLRVPEWKPNNGVCPLARCDGSGWVVSEVGGASGARRCACIGEKGEGKS